jgi:hypothetical protein
MQADLHARVLVRERLARGSIDKQAVLEPCRALLRRDRGGGDCELRELAVSEREHAASNKSRIRESFFAHVLSDNLGNPFSEPITAMEHEFELPREVFRSDPTPVVVLDVPRGVNQIPQQRTAWSPTFAFRGAQSLPKIGPLGSQLAAFATFARSKG